LPEDMGLRAIRTARERLNEDAVKSDARTRIETSGCLPRQSFLGIPISIVGRLDVIRFIAETAGAGGKALVNNVNIQAMNIGRKNPGFAAILKDSDIVFCDGYGVKAVARLAGVRLGERMTPLDWIDELFARCAREGLRVFFLGDEAAIVRAFTEEAVHRHPRLSVAGFHHGYFDLKGPGNDEILTAINESGPDIILVGMGMPRQEFWAYEAMPRLKQGVILAVGALFKYYTGFKKPSPRWLGPIGLEWIWRLVHDPCRLSRRYLVGNPALLLHVLNNIIVKRLAGLL
jgi:N-acetylglucosaminyldiphosphoundecaprenol N-acetyl-beta-D-mannosaminyltransferase